MGTEAEASQDEAAYLRCQVQLLNDEIERLRLTDAEREAIRSACESVKVVGTEKCFTTLRGLLERLGGRQCVTK